MKYEVLMRVDMDIGVFSSDWAYCDRLSSYVARMVSHNRMDSLLYSNLFSSAMNELLETVFRSHGAAGTFSCSVSRTANKDRIELTIPCGPEDSKFYRDAISRLERPDVDEQYRSALFAEGALDPDIGLLELAVDYNARLEVEPSEDSAVRLVAELALEEPLE